MIPAIILILIAIGFLLWAILASGSEHTIYEDEEQAEYLRKWRRKHDGRRS